MEWFDGVKYVNQDHVDIRDVHVDIVNLGELVRWDEASSLTIVNVQFHERRDDHTYNVSDLLCLNGEDIDTIFDNMGQNITSLEMSHLHLDDDARMRLYVHLSQNETITRLTLRHHVQDPSSLVEALLESQTIEYLNVSENAWVLQAMRSFERLIAETTSIQELVLFQSSEIFPYDTWDQIDPFLSALARIECPVQRIHVPAHMSPIAGYAMDILKIERTPCTDGAYKQYVRHLLVIMLREMNCDVMRIIRAMVKRRNPIEIITD